MKEIKIVLSPEAEEVYKYLVSQAENSKTERSILNSFEKKKELVKANSHYGEPIAKDKIPDEYKNKYGVTNLFWTTKSSDTKDIRKRRIFNMCR